MTSVKVIHYALDEDEGGEVILRGVIDHQSLFDLKTADYQREILPKATIDSLVKAFDTGSVPDIVLGMRGHRVREPKDGDSILLLDDVYIVDGLQRVTAGKRKVEIVKENGGRLPRVGAAVHFGTTEPWERQQFRILNADRTKVSSNVLMYNMRHDIPAIAALYAMTRERGFVMHGRVCWRQRKSREELLTALGFGKIIGRLHSHLGPGRASAVDDVARGLQRIMDRVGKNTLRNNTRTLFELVDQCWGVQRVAYKEGAVYMRATFLEVLAMLLSDHLDFWRGDRLFVPAPLVRKIQQFPVKDPQIDNLSSSSGKAREILYILLLEHINSGKRSRRLRPRKERSFLGQIDPENGLNEQDEDSNGDEQ